MTLSPAVQVEIHKLLNRTLASTVDLQARVKNFSYSTKGMGFLSFCQLLEQLLAQLYVWDDAICLRIVVLSGIVVRATDQITQNSEIPNYQLRTLEAQGRILLLAEYLAAYGRSVRSGLDVAWELGDINTSALYVEISRSVDQALSLLEAHLNSSLIRSEFNR